MCIECVITASDNSMQHCWLCLANATSFAILFLLDRGRARVSETTTVPKASLRAATKNRAWMKLGLVGYWIDQARGLGHDTTTTFFLDFAGARGIATS